VGKLENMMLQQSSMNLKMQSIINTISQNTAKKSHNVVQRGFHSPAY